MNAAVTNCLYVDIISHVKSVHSLFTQNLQQTITKCIKLQLNLQKFHENGSLRSNAGILDV